MEENQLDAPSGLPTSSSKASSRKVLSARVLDDVDGHVEAAQERVHRMVGQKCRWAMADILRMARG